MTPTTQLQSNSGYTIGLRVSGQGEAVVLLHGVGMQSAAWEPQFTALSSSHRVFALDLPGHGDSEKLHRDSTLPDFVLWLKDVFDSLDLNPANIVGHSMGALIAAGFAANYPDNTARVALLNGVFRRDTDAAKAVQARAAEITGGNIDPTVALDRWFDADPDTAFAKRKVAGWLGSVDPDGYATAYTAFAKGDATYADRLADITCPFLALTADGDSNSTPAMSQAMAAAVPNGQAAIISGHRHMVNLTAPSVVTNHLRHWLQTPTQ